MFKIAVIYGPTASGKSALAMSVARRLQAVIINSDAMQLYGNARIITARPDEATMQAIPHYLYGVLHAREKASAAVWARRCATLLQTITERRQNAVICGGSGLYLRALFEGLSPIPPISEELREFYETALQTRGLKALYEELHQCDRLWAETIGAHDRQRIIRGLTVFRATGKALSAWHKQAPQAILNDRVKFVPILLMPPRDLLWQRSRTRLHTMVQQGVLAEVYGLLQARLPMTLPLMRAIGVRELAGYLCRRSSLSEALQAAETATRRYIKRQTSWARHNYRPHYICDSADDSACRAILKLL